MLSVKHAAEILDVSGDFIRDHIYRGTISTIALKSAKGSGTKQPVRIPESEIEKLIDQMRPGLDSMVEGVLAR